MAKSDWLSEKSKRDKDAAFLSECERRAGSSVDQMMAFLYDETGEVPPVRRFNVLADWLRHILGDES